MSIIGKISMFFFGNSLNNHADTVLHRRAKEHVFASKQIADRLSANQEASEAMIIESMVDAVEFYQLLDIVFRVGDTKKIFNDALFASRRDSSYLRKLSLQSSQESILNVALNNLNDSAEKSLQCLDRAYQLAVNLTDVSLRKMYIHAIHGYAVEIADHALIFPSETIDMSIGDTFSRLANSFLLD